jgi:uncharacterized membrane protein (UPF0136 family)
MNTKTSGYLIIYGGFLIVMGLLGYLSNPERAKTALMSGGTFGALSILWGVLGARGFAWSRWAALISTSVLAVVFAWRAAVTWSAILQGNSEKLFSVSLITLMLAGSLVMLPVLLRGRQTALAGR